jgi:hypothetical protein
LGEWRQSDDQVKEQLWSRDEADDGSENYAYGATTSRVSGCKE